MGRSLLLSLVLLTLAACGGGEEAQTPEAPLVQVVQVAPADAAGTIRASGLVGYRREPVLSFTAPGMVGDIRVDAGDTVRRGQTLATLRRTTGGANVDEAALAQANAERDLARTQALFERGFVSEARLDDARLAVERTRGSSVIVAPTDGIILRRAAEPAQTVGAGTPILVLGEIRSGVVVRAPVAASQAARILVGDAVTVRVAELGDVTRTGRVTRVGAKGDDATGAFEVEVEVADASSLRSGMVAVVEIATAAAASNAFPTIVVPTLSLLDARADQGIVFVVDAEGIARRRAVRTAGVTQAGVLVVEGLDPGDRVISAGAAYVRDGAPVRIADGG